MNNPHVAEGCMDIGAAPPEPHIAPEPLPVAPAEDFRAKALRRAQEAEAFQKAAQEALEGFGTMVPPWAVAHYAELEKSALDWFAELADRDPGDEA